MIRGANKGFAVLAGRHGQGCVVVGVERERPVVLITRFVPGSIDSVEPKRITKKPELRGFRVYTGAVAAVDITDEAVRAKLALVGPGLWHAKQAISLKALRRFS